MRQKNPIFSNILNKIRVGIVDEEVRLTLSKREIKYTDNNGLIPTMLYSTNTKVDTTNQKYYDKLRGNVYTYKIQYTWKQNIFDKEKYENLVKLPYELSLKIGAQVMHLVNETDGVLVNGSRGVVVEFIEGFPVVLFANGTKRIITPAILDIEEGDTTVVSYAQIPLKLAWAISIHKSQSMTVDLLRIDFKNIFEDGQAYVALSRVSSLDGLYIRNLDFNAIMTNPKALQFYGSL